MWDDWKLGSTQRSILYFSDISNCLKFFYLKIKSNCIELSLFGLMPALESNEEWAVFYKTALPRSEDSPRASPLCPLPPCNLVSDSPPPSPSLWALQFISAALKIRHSDSTPGMARGIQNSEELELSVIWALNIHSVRLKQPLNCCYKNINFNASGKEKTCLIQQKTLKLNIYNRLKHSCILIQNTILYEYKWWINKLLQNRG